MTQRKRREYGSSGAKKKRKKEGKKWDRENMRTAESRRRYGALKEMTQGGCGWNMTQGGYGIWDMAQKGRIWR